MLSYAYGRIFAFYKIYTIIYTVVPTGGRLIMKKVLGVCITIVAVFALLSVSIAAIPVYESEANFSLGLSELDPITEKLIDNDVTSTIESDQTLAVDNQAAKVEEAPIIYSASSDNTIGIWDKQTGLELMKLEGHTAPVKSAVFSPDGKQILSASSDGSVRRWDFPPLQDLITHIHSRFKDCEFTSEERKRY